MNSSLECKEIEIEISEQDPFANDKLERKPFANVLTTIINLYSDKGCVLSINGEWGSGKTTFIKMWQQQLKNNGYRTIYFNAWKNDFNDDPLISILGELNKEFSNCKTFEKVVTNGSKILLKMGETLLRNKIGVDSEILASGISEISNLCRESINRYQDYKQTLEKFKESLSELVASEANGKPVVFIVDELDRCNPHYAVKILERVKHLFDVPNIAFIIAVNDEQLQYAVQGFYGSEKINGKEYLRRFFDMSLALPTPNMSNYVKVLYNKHHFDEVFSSSRNSYNTQENEMFLHFATELFSGANINLRLANKIFAYTRLALCNFHAESRIDSDTILLLCYLKICYSHVYNKIKQGAYNIQELIDTIESILPIGVFLNSNSMQNNDYSVWAIAGLISYYRYINIGNDRFPIFKGENIGGTPHKKYPISTNIIDIDSLFEALSNLEYDPNYKYGIGSIISRIEISSGLYI